MRKQNNHCSTVQLLFTFYSLERFLSPVVTSGGDNIGDCNKWCGHVPSIPSVTDAYGCDCCGKKCGGNSQKLTIIFYNNTLIIKAIEKNAEVP